MTAWLGLEKKNNFLACPLPLFTKKLVVWLFCCLVVLLIARSPQLRQRDFSLFTLHFSLFTKEETATASAILHSSFYILHLINE